MRIRKYISKILVAGILVNNLSFISNAGTLSPDTRYETFEGDAINIDDVLEEDKVDVEIEGNTLVNLIESSSRNVQLKTKKSGTNSDGTTYFYFMNKANIKFPLKSNTEYTIAFKITDNPYDHIPFSTIVLGQGDKNTGHGLDTWSNRLYWNKDFNMKEGEPGLGFYQTTFTTSTRIEETSFLWIGFVGQGFSDFNTSIEDIVLVEGGFDLNNYFEGMKSVGEQENDNHSIEIKSQNKNILPNNFINKSWIEPYRANARIASEFIPYKRNTSYTVYGLDGNAYKDVFIEYSNEIYKLGTTDNINIVRERIAHSTKISSVTFTPNPNYKYMAIYTYSLDYPDNYVDIAEISVCEGDTPPLDYIKPESKDFNINLSQPLRGLPNGVRDRVVKRNGQMFIERNLSSVVIDGSEAWQLHDVMGTTARIKIMANNIFTDFKSGTLMMSDRLPFKLDFNADEEHFYSDHIFMLFINVDRVSQPTIDNFKQWMSKNPITVVYQLNAPIYEPLNIDLSTNLFKDTTYISSNSTIPAIIRVTVDRVANRAKEFSEIANLNPTVDNMSQARYWTNLMRESALKDVFQSSLDTVNNIINLPVIEKKNTSVNTDIYIKPQNVLSITLSTNNITFEDFDSTEDIEKLNALNITVSSSLPYSLNAYLESEIENKDKTNSLNKSILNIRESSQADYKVFSNINNKVVLKDNNLAGKQISHSIDLKLDSSVLHKADVYKTTVKFEVEQK